jgi:hypothetical protein
MTYGSYRNADGRLGHCSQYMKEDFRHDMWRASHLKTFRAGLFKQIREEDLKDDQGNWLELCVDLAVTFPMLEMSGLKHSKFIPNILVVYNTLASFEHNTDAEGRAREANVAAMLRNRTPYAKLTEAVWRTK